jgi:hypothetical protein
MISVIEQVIDDEQMPQVIKKLTQNSSEEQTRNQIFGPRPVPNTQIADKDTSNQIFGPKTISGNQNVQPIAISGTMQTPQTVEQPIQTKGTAAMPQYNGPTINGQPISDPKTIQALKARTQFIKAK